MKKYLQLLLVTVSTFVPSIGLAGNITLNLTYPKFGGVDLNANQDLISIISFIYGGIIAISGLAAFIMIVWGGLSWMSSAGNPTKISDAKDRIGKALLGLLIVLASYLILQIINPELTILNSPDV